MDMNHWRFKSPRNDRVFNPDNDVIASTPPVIAQVMVKTKFFDQPGLQHMNDFIRPVSPDPTLWCRANIIKIDAHG